MVIYLPKLASLQNIHEFLGKKVIYPLSFQFLATNLFKIIDTYIELYFLVFLFLKYLFIWLRRVLVAAGGLLSCGMRTLSCSMHVESTSLTRDGTRALCIGSLES